jgi:hypothetical protein
MQTLAFIIFIFLDITCQSVIGYYVGKFESPIDRSTPFHAQFDFFIDANLNDKRVYFGVQNWNTSYADIYEYLTLDICNPTDNL